MENSFVLPPVYATNDPLPPSFNSNFKCRVHFSENDLKVKKMVICNGLTVADEFALFFLDKINTNLSWQRRKDDWVFKASGTAEYLYGHHRMIDFEHVRRCLTKGQIPEFTLLSKRAIEEEMDSDDKKVGSTYRQVNRASPNI